MFRSISHTFFAALVTTSIALVITMAIATRISLGHGFDLYVTRVELGRLGIVADTLKQAYADHQSWQFLRDDPDALVKMMGRVRRQLAEQNTTRNDAQDDMPPPPPPQNARSRPTADNLGDWQTPYHDGRPPPPDGPGNARRDRPPPPFDGPGDGRPDRPPPDRRGPDFEGRDRPPPPGARPPPPDRLGLLRRLAVLDVDGSLITGNPKALNGPREPLQWQPDASSPSRLIGYMALQPQIDDHNELSVAFISSQSRNLFGIALAALLASAGAALLLARHVKKPIAALADASRQLAKGDFEVQLAENRRDEIGQVAHAFNAMARTLKAHEHSRRQWVADTSHELRTPLAILQARIEAMSDGVMPSSPESYKVLLGAIGELNGLVDDLHELARADLGELQYRMEPIAVAEIIETATNSFDARFRKMDLRFSQDNQVPVSSQIKGDRLRLARVIGNLLANSARYTDVGGEVRLSARADGGWVEIAVDDSPPGVPPAALDKLFDRFFRVEGSRQRESGGSGLGLAIVKALVEAHRGSVHAEASPLGGLRVVVRLPQLHE